MSTNKRTHCEEGDDLAFLGEPKRTRFYTPATPPSSDAEDCEMDDSVQSLCVSVKRMNTRRGILYILKDDRGILSIGSARNAADLPRYDVDKVKLYWGHTLNVERDMMLATTYFGNPRLVLQLVFALALWQHIAML